MLNLFVSVEFVLTRCIFVIFCWTPVSGSFESIVEEDEELNDEEDLGTTEAAKITQLTPKAWKRSLT